jgi:very-short-patch-repair endonuclease
MVQAIRRAGLPDPVRQYVVTGRDGEFVARVDLCWPDLGIFIELDGQHHKGQPVYDANRQTRVVTATGWLVARYTWTEVVHTPKTCERRLKELLGLRLIA